MLALFRDYCPLPSIHDGSILVLHEKEASMRCHRNTRQNKNSTRQG